MKIIYCLGPSGSYSYIIAKKMYPNQSINTCESFSAIIDKVLSDENALGVLPIENSSTSDVHENINYLFTKDLLIIDEGYLKIRLNLIGLKKTNLKNIKTVYSHPKALAQTTKFIDQYGFSMNETKSTAEGKEIILNENDQAKACIGSQDLAADKRLKIIQENIGNAKNNLTRFIVVSKKNNYKAVSFNKTSFIFRLKHQPGTLANLLTKLASLGVNLTKIESRPIPESQWEYQFLVDLEFDQEIMEKIEKVFADNTLMTKNIGVYRNGKIYES